MGLTVKETSGGNYNPVSEGLHQAVCYALYDLGTQYNATFGKSAKKVLIAWEIPSERIDVDHKGETVNLPRAISRQYTQSLHEKSGLRKDLESWRGKVFTEHELEGFDLTKLLGANCMLQVIHKHKDNKTFANVANVVSLPKTMPKVLPENTTKYFSFEEHQSEIPDGTPDWIKDIIKASEEWGHIAGGNDGNSSQESSPFDDVPPPTDDDIPF